MHRWTGNCSFLRATVRRAGAGIGVPEWTQKPPRDVREEVPAFSRPDFASSHDGYS